MIPSATSLQDYDFRIMSMFDHRDLKKKEKKKELPQQPGF